MFSRFDTNWRVTDRQTDEQTDIFDSTVRAMHSIVWLKLESGLLRNKNTEHTYEATLLLAPGRRILSLCMSVTRECSSVCGSCMHAELFRVKTEMCKFRGACMPAVQAQRWPGWSRGPDPQTRSAILLRSMQIR